MTQTSEQNQLARRKQDHIDLCATGDVAFKGKTTLLEQVELVHDAVPELSLDDIDLSVRLFGKTLRAPIFIAAMTGGTDRAAEINRELAGIAEAHGYGFGFGSQRPMLRGQDDASYLVRDVAPNALILGNIGGVQASALDLERTRDLVDRVGADALCIHLNPAMEVVQPEGDRDFRGVLATYSTLVRELGKPIIAKETGCGIGPRAAEKLAAAGVRHVDVSGAGGTSWVAVETLRAEGEGKALGALLRDWGVPTALSILSVRNARPRFDTVIATGGVKDGVDAARAIALGASAVGIARPVLQALLGGGREEAVRFLARVERELRTVMLLTASRKLSELREAPVILGPDLARQAKIMAPRARRAIDRRAR